MSMQFFTLCRHLGDYIIVLLSFLKKGKKVLHFVPPKQYTGMQALCANHLGLSS
jgi:hypothetical protein